MTNTWWRLLALVLILVIGLPLAAHAEDPAPSNALGLSRSESGPWAPKLAEPLFDPTDRWVPGDVQTAQFWARNQATDSTELRILVIPRVQDLIESGELDAEIRTDGGAWEALTTTWTPPISLAPGQKSLIEIRAELPRPATNGSQALTFSFDIRARLTYTGPDTSATPKPSPSPTQTPGPGDVGDTGNDENKPDDPDGAEDGNLSSTGASHPTWLLPLGLGALATGIGLAMAARRRNDDCKESEF